MTASFTKPSAYDIDYDATTGDTINEAVKANENAVDYLFTNIKDADTSTKGIVELATDAECITGTSTTLAATPAGIAAYYADNTLSNLASNATALGNMGFSDFAITLIDDADAPAMQTTLGLVIGSGAGELVACASNAKLPAYDGSALTDLTLSQVTDAGTAAGYDVGTGADQLPTNSLLNILPVGSVFLAPDGDLVSTVLECDGSSISRTTYSDLFLGVGVEAPALSAAAHTDVKGSITQLVVDTANTSGHFNVACPAAVKAGCRMVIAGTDYTITALTDDGTGTDEVEFDGTLAAGAHTVTGIHGTVYSGGVLALNEYGSGQVQIPQATGTAMTNANHNSTSANTCFDGVTVATDTNSCGYNAGTLRVGKDWGDGNTRNLNGVKVYGASNNGYAQGGASVTMTLYGSNAGFGIGGVPLAVIATALSDTNTTNMQSALSGVTPGDYRYHWVEVVPGSSAATLLAEVEFFEQDFAVPTGAFYTVALPAIDDAIIPDIASAAVTGDANSQTLVFAFSFDGGSTMVAWDGDSWESVTTSASTGWMTEAVLEAIADADWTTPTGDIIVYVGFQTSSASSNPSLSFLAVTDADAAESMPIGTTFGTGDGSTTFNLPDLSGDAPTGFVYVIKY